MIMIKFIQFQIVTQVWKKSSFGFVWFSDMFS